MPPISRLIVIDWSVILHKAIFALKFSPQVPATYTAQAMILGMLFKIGVEPDDVIMFALDGRHSWRKEFEAAYKGNRQANRDASGIDWDHWFVEFDKLRQRLNEQTNWIFVGPIEHIEADDIAAVACRYFKDVPEIILCTIDSDWEQMWSIHPGVKIFSLQSKEWKIRPEEYNVYAELAKKINKEVSDNLVTTVTTAEEYDRRLMCVDLTRLPEWVENSVIDALSNPALYDKHICPETMPSPSLQPRLDSLYNDKSKQIVYELQIAKAQKKEFRKKQKILLAKAKVKRTEERMLKKAQKYLMVVQKQTKKLNKKPIGEQNGKVS